MEELPQRADNHIKETAGNKILQNFIPAEWIIRDVTERDYGIDCYLELVNKDHKLTGEVAFIQMKTTGKIGWRKSDDGFKFNDVDRKTTNYLKSFKIPTYLFLVDLSTEEMFFLSVKRCIQEHYKEYLKPGVFSYDFSHSRDLFTVKRFVESFERDNLYEQFRNELQYFISNLHKYIDFMEEHCYRDCFMQIDKEDMMFFESLERNICFLQGYFNTNNKLTTIDKLIAKGNSIYGDDYENTIFEGVLTDLFDEFKKSVLEIIDIVTDIVTKKEIDYWYTEKYYIFCYFQGLDKTSLFDR